MGSRVTDRSALPFVHGGYPEEHEPGNMTKDGAQRVVCLVVLCAPIGASCVPRGTLIEDATSTSVASTSSAGGGGSGTGGSSTESSSASSSGAGGASPTCTTLDLIDDVPYQLIAANSSLCATILDNQTQPDVGLIQYPCLSPAVTNQQFVLQGAGDCHFTIQALNSGLCLTVAYGSASDDVAMIQAGCMGAANQSFALQATSGGRLLIIDDNSGKCVTVAENSMSNDSTLIQYQCVPGELDQEWTFNP
jgi:Ricin-type beta-trefoil lectin domain